MFITNLFSNLKPNFTIFSLLLLSLVLLNGCEALNQKTAENTETAKTSTNAENKTETAKNESETSENKADGLCANEFYPIKTDFERQYKISGTAPASYVLSQTAPEGEKFTEKRNFASGLEITNNWLCTENGLRNAEFNNAATAPNMNFTMETLESSGVTFPKVWEKGQKWTTDYKISAKANAGMASGSADGTVTIENELISTDDKISVPGGEFTAARIDSVINMNLKMNGGKIPSPSIKMSNWFAPEIGLVKQDVKSGYGNVIVEYTGKK